MNAEGALPNWPSKRGLPQTTETELIHVATLLSTKAKLWRLGSLAWQLNPHTRCREHLPSTGHQLSTTAHVHQRAQSCALCQCSLPNRPLSLQHGHGMTAGWHLIRATGAKMSPCTVYPALRNTQGTASMDTPQHWSTAESHCSHSESPLVLWSHGIKQCDLCAPLDHSCWDVWAWLIPMGTHFCIPATGPSNLMLHLREHNLLY